MALFLLRALWAVADWITRRFVALGFLLLGIGGAPSSIEQWEKWANDAFIWIDDAMSDPRAVWLAERAVQIAEFLNQWPIRAALVIVGVIMLIWPLRWFWRWRHSAGFWLRHKLSDKVWIAHEQAKAS